MTTQQRYTGPELSALLREVRAELGDQATIHEANRIRTGGIGGFFRKEGFEVLASPPASGRRSESSSAGFVGRPRTSGEGAIAMGAGTGHLAVSESLEADEELIAKLTAAMASEQAWIDAIGASATLPPPVIEKRPVRRFGPEDLAPISDELDRIAPATTLLDDPQPQVGWSPEAATPGQALLERADAVSAHERVGQLLEGARGLIDDATISDRTRTFHRAAQPLAAERPKPTTSTLPVTQPIAPTVNPPAAANASESATPPKRSTAMVSETAATDTTDDATDFWADLARLETMLPIRPTTQASVQLLVGPLDLALPLATRFASDASIELSVFTEEVELPGLEEHQLADSSHDLHRRLLDRADTDARAIGVIEADDARRSPGASLDTMLTPRLLAMIDRVCDAGAVHLVRLTLRSLGPIDELQQLLGSFAVPCAIDLGTAPSAADLDAALDAQLPIISVAGRQLTPSLAMALKQR